MITAFIKGQAIETTESVIVAESLNYLKAQFVFITSDWNGLKKKAYFMQGDTTHSKELDENNVAFPLHLSAGEWAVSVVGREYADVPWAEGAVANAPWGATNATIHYNTTYDENGNPIEAEV